MHLPVRPAGRSDAVIWRAGRRTFLSDAMNLGFPAAQTPRSVKVNLDAETACAGMLLSACTHRAIIFNKVKEGGGRFFVPRPYYEPAHLFKYSKGSLEPPSLTVLKAKSETLRGQDQEDQAVWHPHTPPATSA